MKKTLVFLDDNNDLRDLLTSYLELALGVDCQGLASLSDFEKNSQFILQSSLVILDIELGFNQPSGIEAYNWLRQHGFKGPIIFLTGHGHSNELVQQALKIGATVWEKPMSGEKMVRSLRQILFPDDRQVAPLRP